MTIEELAKQIFNECEKENEPVTMEEALEMAKMEIGSKEIKNYVQAEVEKKPKAPRERKVDNEKAEILENVKRGLTLLLNSTTIKIENENKLHFEYGGNAYTLNLIKHRPPKGKG